VPYGGRPFWRLFRLGQPVDEKQRGTSWGFPASDHPTEMRVVDIYRREGDKLSENWIFIDILHFLNLQGLDILGRMREILRT
jgi:hypothetical protein